MAIPKVPEKTFKFTRHVLSCNNINMGDGFITNHDYEPGLSHSGILETLEYVKVHREDFESCDVCVSNLYRTWCTAVILYGNGYQEEQNPDMYHYLNLWICPHLKEHYPKTSLYKRGNAPRPMKEMAERFKTFLDTLMIIINNDQNKYTDFHFPNKIYLKLSTSDSSIMYTKTEPKEGEPHYYSYSNEYDEKDNEYYIDKTYKLTLNEKWLKTGNLSTFMDWFNNDFAKKKKAKFDTEKVHVVTHSNVMQNYLKELSLNKLKKKYDHEGRFCFTKKSHKPYYTKVTNIDFIGKTNCWSFETKSSFLGEIQAFFNKNNLLSKKISDILSNKISIHDMIIELNQYNANSITHLISILSSIKMGVIERHDANKIESKNEHSLCGKYKQKTKKGGKLKRKKTTRKRRNTRTRKKSFVKRGGCYGSEMEIHINDPNTQKQINEIYPPWDEEKELEKAIIYNSYPKSQVEEKAKKIKNKYNRETIINPILSREKQIMNFGDDISDDDPSILYSMLSSKTAYDSREAIKDEIIHFVKTYPDKTYLEYIPFSFNKDNLVFEELSSNIFKLDKDGRPIFNTYRELLDENHTHLWNILHKDDGLSTYAIIDFKSMDEQKYSSSYDEIKDKLIKTSCNNQLKQNIETYIKRHPNNTYEDWINQDDIFRKYVMPDKRNIFSIMYLDEHPALHYWNEYSKNENNSNNLVTRRTKENKDSAKPNDPNIYVYKIENKKP